VSTRAKILAALDRDDGVHVSGHALADALGVSRNAVWKQIETLRRSGYDIEGSHARGYRLLARPDRISEQSLRVRLRTRWLARDLVCHESTGSTNDDAAVLARAGAADGTVVIADAQTAGRGRLGREWVSRPAINLYVSIVLRPRIAPAEAPQLSLVAGVAVARALELHGVEPKIKWPNDVLLGGRKVCGVLTEIEAEADMVGYVVVGIGVNLNSRLDDFPEELHDKAVSLSMTTGRPVDRTAFAADLLACFESAYDAFREGGFDALRGDWTSRAALIGRRVEVAGTSGTQAGVCVGIDTDGALLLKSDGADQTTPALRIIAGDVTLAGGYGGYGE
jgi:BirA family biotin operon repressor/biotin-[acetyl-CoA-carboxylase] ligase